MNRSVAFTFADYRQQVLDILYIKACTAMQCTFQYNFFSYDLAHPINKTLKNCQTRFVYLLSQNNHQCLLFTHGALSSPHRNSVDIPTKIISRTKGFCPKLNFPARVFAFFRTLLSPTLRADFANVFRLL